MARRELLYFVRETMPHRFDAAGRLYQRGYRPAWYHAVIASALDRVVSGKCRRLMLFMPPRHGKSELVSIRLPAFALGKNPARRIVAASYGSDLAHEMSRQAQRVIDSEEYRAIFPDVRLGKLRNVDEWEVGNRAGARFGGRYKCAGVGGALTGRGFDLGLIDDPIKDRMEADSATHRERVWDWYTSVFFTRRNGPDAAIVLVQTRWHEDDLAGRLLRDVAERRGEPWEIISLPALAEPESSRPYDPRREGEPLWPERFGVAALAATREQSSRDWSALFQQRPAPAAGAVFRREWFRYYDRLPHSILQREGAPPAETSALLRFATVDLAASTKTGADYTVFAIWGLADSGDLYLLDVVRGQFDAPTTLARLTDAVREWSLQFVRVESVAYQLAFIQLAQAQGLPVVEQPADRDKLSRAYAAAPLMEQGKVFFPRDAEWLHRLEGELLAFPVAPHDDQVDAIAYGMLAAREAAQGAIAPSGKAQRPGWTWR